MVESVKPSTISIGDLRVGAVTRVAAPAPATTPVAVKAAEATPTLAKAMAASAPVDAGRVKLIKDAVQNGTFPLSPATVADRLIALKYEWMQHDQA